MQKNALSVAQVLQDAVERVFGERLDVKGCSRTDAGVHANRFALTLRTNAAISCPAVTRALNVNLPDDIAVLGCREDLALHWKYPLNTERMNESAQAFLGAHDFAAFCSAGGKKEDTIRVVTKASVIRQGEMVQFSVTGNGFLYNMVRIMVGTLLEISRGAISPDSIPAILESRMRSMAGPTAPPHGLYLDEVFYDEADLFEEK